MTILTSTSIRSGAALLLALALACGAQTAAAETTAQSNLDQIAKAGGSDHAYVIDTAGNVQQAFESMFQGRPRTAREWGDLVRRASKHRGPWPRVSVWHGDADEAFGGRA